MVSLQNIEQVKNRIFNSLTKLEFENLALDLFAFQIENNPIYASYASLILKNQQPKKIREIPFLPIEFFKQEQIICKGKKIEEIFLSSGTTGSQSKHLVSNISIYKTSFQKSFKLFYGEPSDYCILSLLPSYNEREGSSLIYMVNNLIKNSSHQNSGSYFNNYQKLSKIIKVLEERKQKTILIGVSYALLNLAEQFPQQLEHTIIIETGGTKGKTKEILKEELHEILKNAFGLDNIHSEYGMTELLSQSYSKGKGIFYSPPWKQVLIRDINDPLYILGNDVSGGINIIDLGNIYSCPFIATQDLGRKYEDGGFSVLGRLNNAEIRGCNLLIE